MTQALTVLALFDDPYLNTQATCLTAVDQCLTRLEEQALGHIGADDEDRAELPDLVLLLALSQMWIFSAYELLRTWRHRAKDIIKWAENGGLQQKVDALRQDVGYRHPGREMRAMRLEEVLKNPSLVEEARLDLDRTHILFARLEMLRIALAKHEIAGRPKAVAYAPGYGRINTWTGALDFELENGRYIIGNISRRNVADEIRAIDKTTPPQTKEELKAFDDFMSGKLTPSDPEMFDNGDKDKT